MDNFLSFISSSLFANILALVSLLIALLPQKDTVAISQSTNYYFDREKEPVKKTDNTLENFGIILKVIFAYILYAFLYQYFYLILISLTLCVIIRYRYLKIKFVKQIILPIILTIYSIVLNFFLPSDVSEYWKNTNKVDINQFSSLSKTVDQLAHPLKELFNLFITAQTNSLSVAILANLLFILIAILMMTDDLFEKKTKIKSPKLFDIIITIVILTIIYSFIFYSNSNSISHIVIDSLNKFLKS